MTRLLTITINLALATAIMLAVAVGLVILVVASPVISLIHHFGRRHREHK